MRKKKKIRDIFCESLDFPSGLGGGESSVEIFSGKRVLIRGCMGILEYGESLISLRIKEGKLDIIGRGLYCSAYMSGVVEISGRVLSVGYGEER